MSDHMDQDYDAFARETSEWLASGEVQAREDVAHDLEGTPDVLTRVLSRRNVYKTLVEV